GIASARAAGYRGAHAASDLERRRPRRERAVRDRRGELLLPAGRREPQPPEPEHDPHDVPVEGRRELLRRRRRRADEPRRRLVLPRAEGRRATDQGPRRVLARRHGRALAAAGGTRSRSSPSRRIRRHSSGTGYRASGSTSTADIPAPRAPTTSMPKRSPTYSAASAGTSSRSSASSKMRRAGFSTPTTCESTIVAKRGASPARARSASTRPSAFETTAST